jgi:uncharacterized membrane protein YfcA
MNHMELYSVLGYLLAVIVGITLGLVGSGGSILSVPILVYIMGIEPILATAYSLFIVGITALFGGIQKAKQKLVDFRKVILFGIPTIFSVFITRKLIVPRIPEILFTTSHFTLHKSVFIMIIFALVMLFASIRMINPLQVENQENEEKLNYSKIFIHGSIIGLIAGFVGAGGGFLIIPALLFLAKTPMKMAVGTSLFIVALQSLIGFLGDLRPEQNLDWNVLINFTICAIIGVLIGSFLSKKIEGEKLKTGFGWFVLSMGIYIIFKELLFK